MRKKHEYILMYQDDEIFSFSITFGKTNKIDVLEKLNHFDKAPYGINENTSMEDVKRIFFRFLNRRSIASSRIDFDNILKATNCKDRLELAFKGHGLSLHDHYWYRKKDEVLKQVRRACRSSKIR